MPMGKGKKEVRRVRSKVDLGKLDGGLIARLKNIFSGAGDKRKNSQAGDGR